MGVMRSSVDRSSPPRSITDLGGSAVSSLDIQHWILFPQAIEGLVMSMNNARPAVLSISFVVFIVVCYFVGVVLRLPPVDYVEAISIQYNLRHHLKSDAPGPPNFWYRIWWWLRPSGAPPIQWTQVVGKLTPRPSDAAKSDVTLPVELHHAVRHIAARNLTPAIQNKVPPHSSTIANSLSKTSPHAWRLTSLTARR